MIITINEKEIELNCGEFLTVKELRKVLPVINKQREDGHELDMVVEVARALAVDPDQTEAIIDSMTMDEVNEFSATLLGLVDPEKKTLNGSENTPVK